MDGTSVCLNASPHHVRVENAELTSRNNANDVAVNADFKSDHPLILAQRYGWTVECRAWKSTKRDWRFTGPFNEFIKYG